MRALSAIMVNAQLRTQLSVCRPPSRRWIARGDLVHSSRIAQSAGREYGYAGNLRRWREHLDVAPDGWPNARPSHRHPLHDRCQNRGANPITKWLSADFRTNRIHKRSFCVAVVGDPCPRDHFRAIENKNCLPSAMR